MPIRVRTLIAAALTALAAPTDTSLAQNVGGSSVTSITTTCPVGTPQSGAVVLNGGISVARTVVGTTDTVLAGDCGQLVRYNSSSAVAVTLPTAGNIGFTSGYYVTFENFGTATATITTTTSNINPTGAHAIALASGQSFTLQSDGNNWTAIGYVAAGSGGVTSSSNSDGSLVVSPTTGASIASLNTAHANTWSVTQIFDGVQFNLGSDATGDLYYRTSEGAIARLGIGSGTQFLGVSGGLPAWGTPSGGGGGAVSSVSNVDGTLVVTPTTGAVVASLNLANTNVWSAAQTFDGAQFNFGSDATGDIYYRTSGGALARLGVGGPGEFIGNSGGLPAWGTPTGTGSGVTTVSNSDGSLTVTPTSGNSVASLNVANPNIWTGKQTIESGEFTLGSDAAGDLYYRTSGGALARLGVGSGTQFLGVSGGLPAWATPTGGVSSVSNVDGSLTVTPTTGTPVATLNMGNANTWTATQTFESAKFSLGSDATGDIYYRTSGGGLARLGVGSGSQFLGVSAGLPAWGTPSGSASGTYPASYVSGNWIVPYGEWYMQAGSAISANTVYCTFGYFGANVTVKTAGLVISTASSSNNVQIGLYSLSGGTLYLVDNTASISTTTLGFVSAPVGKTTDALSVGTLYALCINSNSTPAFDAPGLVIATMAQLVGATSGADAVATSMAVGKSISQTFNTWPGTITLSSMADVTSKLPAIITLQVN